MADLALSDDVKGDLKAFQRALSGLQQQLQPFLNGSLKELESQLDVFQRASLHGVLAQAAASLFQLLLRTRGQDPEEHPFAKDVETSKRFVKKARKVLAEKELSEAKRHTLVNVEAANRFITHAIPELTKDQKQALKQAGKRQQESQAAQPTKRKKPMRQPNAAAQAEAFLATLP
jgi:exosome complex protein LRP1